MKISVKRRIMTALTISVCICLCLTTQVSAAPATPEQYLDAMGDRAFSWYLTLCKIAVPLLILSFASCGFKFIGSVFVKKGEFSFDESLKHFFMSVSSLAVLLLLPLIMTWAKELLQPLGWKPPTPTLPGMVSGAWIFSK